MEDFNSMWNEDNVCELTPQELNEERPEYVIRNSVARYENLANILLFYFHAKHGEPMREIVMPGQVDFAIRGK